MDQLAPKALIRGAEVRWKCPSKAFVCRETALRLSASLTSWQDMRKSTSSVREGFRDMASFIANQYRLLMCAVLFAFSLGASAQASVTPITVTVGGTQYKVASVFPPGSQSFSEAQAANWMVPFTNTPWYGPGTSAKPFALDIAEAVANELSSLLISFRVPWRVATSGFVEYAYAVNTSSTTQVSGFNGRGGPATGSNDGQSGAAQHLWITQVPEIDGPVLARAFFVLGALYLLLRGQVGRRRIIT